MRQSFITKYVRNYKVRQVLQSVREVYYEVSQVLQSAYKVRQVLQSVTETAITKYVRYYKV